MRFKDGIKPYGISLYIKKIEALVISDLHIGYSDSLQKNGFMVPNNNEEKMRIWLQIAIKKFKPKTLIINGDIKHEFGKPVKSFAYRIRKFFEVVPDDIHLIIIKGNHDNFINYYVKHSNLHIMDNFVKDDILICHGDVISKDISFAKTIIIGHEHPAINLAVDSRKEKYKCFILGKYEKKKLIVMPSFNPITMGSDVLGKSHLSPFLEDISGFRIFVVDDNMIDVLDFGKVGMIREG